MADNILLDAGTGGETIRSDDDGTAQWQYVKLAYGADGTRTIVDETNRFPTSSRKDINPYDGSTSLTTKFAVVNATASGDNEIVALVASKKIRVLAAVLIATANVDAIWQSSTAGNISGTIPLGKRGGYAISSDYGLFETTAGEALQLNLSSATSVQGFVSYVEV